MELVSKQAKYQDIFDSFSTEDMKMRLIERNDFDKGFVQCYILKTNNSGYIELLKQLTKVGKVEKEDFQSNKYIFR